MTQGILLLDDGTALEGKICGFNEKPTVGEICFNTGMTGYQEVLTDPSYAKQIVTFSFPYIGNYGYNNEDVESTQKPVASGCIIRNEITQPSNYRSVGNFEDFLKYKKISCITGIDTRFLIEKIRKKEVSNCVISKGSNSDIPYLQGILKSFGSMDGMELASEGTCTEIYKFCDGKQGKCIVVIDCGCKQSILNCLKQVDCEVFVVPLLTSFEKIQELKPNGIMLSNGPGDPRKTLLLIKNTLSQIIENKIPIFGICLGHQMLAEFLGCTVKKLPQGHRGINHPVYNYDLKKVEITAQNHGFAVTAVANNVFITHKSLFDGVIEGIKSIDNSKGFIASVQYHPEASSGPHDSFYLFKEFANNL